MRHVLFCVLFFFFFNDTATTEIYTLSLHDALPIFLVRHRQGGRQGEDRGERAPRSDRKSTRLNSSHSSISYAVFCLKKNKHQTPCTGPQSRLPTDTLAPTSSCP